MRMRKLIEVKRLETAGILHGIESAFSRTVTLSVALWTYIVSWDRKMTSESEDIELFNDSGIGPNTMNLLAELHAVQGINSDTGSVTTIPPTPKKHRRSHGSSNTSALRRLAFAPAVDRPTSVCRSAQTRNGSTSTPVYGNPTVTGKATSSGGEHILEILSEVKKTNSTLTEYGERLDTLEQRMFSIEQKGLETPSSSCSDTIKTNVPPAVRVCLTFR